MLRFVDYQLASVAPPAQDLAYAMYASFHPPMRRANYDRLLLEYVDSLDSALRAYGWGDALPVLTFEDLKAEMERYAPLRIMSLGLVHAVVTNDSGTVFDMETTLRTRGKSGINPDMYTGKYMENTGEDWREMAENMSHWA